MASLSVEEYYNEMDKLLERINANNEKLCNTLDSLKFNTKKKEDVVEEVKKETEATTAPVVIPEVVEPVQQQAVTMQNRRVEPAIKIKVKPSESSFPIKVKTGEELKKEEQEEKEVEHRLHHTLEHLIGIPYKIDTVTKCNLLEVVTQDGRFVTIDFNGLIYDNGLKFFLGRIYPGDEYELPCYAMTKVSLAEAFSNGKVEDKFMYPKSLQTLNKILDVSSLKETDKSKRESTLENATTALTNDTISKQISGICGNVYRFSFARYVGPKDFTLEFTPNSLASVLDKESTFVTHKTGNKYVYVTVKGDSVTLQNKSEH